MNRELNAARVRVAVMMPDSALFPIVKGSAWCLKGIKPFGANELAKALTFLGETDVNAVRLAIRELGGVASEAAP